jgi:hypothetical protein
VIKKVIKSFIQPAPAIFFLQKTPAIVVTPKKLLNVWGFVLFLLEIAVSYCKWVSLLLFHILSQSESLNSQ